LAGEGFLASRFRSRSSPRSQARPDLWPRLLAVSDGAWLSQSYQNQPVALGMKIRQRPGPAVMETAELAIWMSRSPPLHPYFLLGLRGKA
jgi:hypothetical protein